MNIVNSNAHMMMLCVWLLDLNLQKMLQLWFYKCFDNSSFNDVSLLDRN
jgi:hypothetical protein